MINVISHPFQGKIQRSRRGIACFMMAFPCHHFFIGCPFFSLCSLLTCSFEKSFIFFKKYSIFLLTRLNMRKKCGVQEYKRDVRSRRLVASIQIPNHVTIKKSRKKAEGKLGKWVKLAEKMKRDEEQSSGHDGHNNEGGIHDPCYQLQQRLLL